ncbi:replication-associated recombination protein A [Babesia caballi]|uniref:Replication-associated recombination protein A n=1 Tax=Babesia caballi TaxID=5871 RepID=A0AAV4LW44_BABCB|nr:replication-associated recombination protein A [Babesia caballi]
MLRGGRREQHVAGEVVRAADHRGGGVPADVDGEVVLQAHADGARGLDGPRQRHAETLRLVGELRQHEVLQPELVRRPQHRVADRDGVHHVRRRQALDGVLRLLHVRQLLEEVVADRFHHGDGPVTLHRLVGERQRGGGRRVLLQPDQGGARHQAELGVHADGGEDHELLVRLVAQPERGGELEAEVGGRGGGGGARAHVLPSLDHDVGVLELLVLEEVQRHAGAAPQLPEPAERALTPACAGVAQVREGRLRRVGREPHLAHHEARAAHAHAEPVELSLGALLAHRAQKRHAVGVAAAQELARDVETEDDLLLLRQVEHGGGDLVDAVVQLQADDEGQDDAVVADGQRASLAVVHHAPLAVASALVGGVDVEAYGDGLTQGVEQVAVHLARDRRLERQKLGPVLLQERGAQARHPGDVPQERKDALRPVQRHVHVDPRSAQVGEGLGLHRGLAAAEVQPDGLHQHLAAHAPPDVHGDAHARLEPEEPLRRLEDERAVGVRVLHDVDDGALGAARPGAGGLVRHLAGREHVVDPREAERDAVLDLLGVDGRHRERLAELGLLLQLARVEHVGVGERAHVRDEGRGLGPVADAVGPQQEPEVLHGGGEDAVHLVGVVAAQLNVDEVEAELEAHAHLGEQALQQAAVAWRLGGGRHHRGSSAHQVAEGEDVDAGDGYLQRFERHGDADALRETQAADGARLAVEEGAARELQPEGLHEMGLVGLAGVVQRPPGELEQAEELGVALSVRADVLEEVEMLPLEVFGGRGRRTQLNHLEPARGEHAAGEVPGKVPGNVAAARAEVYGKRGGPELPAQRLCGRTLGAEQRGAGCFRLQVEVVGRLRGAGTDAEIKRATRGNAHVYGRRQEGLAVGLAQHGRNETPPQARKARVARRQPRLRPYGTCLLPQGVLRVLLALLLQRLQLCRRREHLAARRGVRELVAGAHQDAALRKRLLAHAEVERAAQVEGLRRGAGARETRAFRLRHVVRVSQQLEPHVVDEVLVPDPGGVAQHVQTRLLHAHRGVEAPVLRPVHRGREATTRRVAPVRRRREGLRNGRQVLPEAHAQAEQLVHHLPRDVHHPVRKVDRRTAVVVLVVVEAGDHEEGRAQTVGVAVVHGVLVGDALVVHGRVQVVFDAAVGARHDSRGLLQSEERVLLVLVRKPVAEADARVVDVAEALAERGVIRLKPARMEAAGAPP